MSKPTTAYTNPSKPTTSYADVAKPTTPFANNSSIASILLNDASVTLNSTTYLLSGYTGATPNQLNNKSTTVYAEV